MASSSLSTCGCKPGTAEDGWQEVRSQACLDAEMQAWREMIARMREASERG